jgi:hypothetical protein
MQFRPGKYDFIGISYWWESDMYYPVYYSVNQQRPNPMIPNGHHEYLYEPHVRLVPMNKKVIGYNSLEQAQRIVESWRREAGLTNGHIDLNPKKWNGQAPHMRLRLLSDYNLKSIPDCMPGEPWIPEPEFIVEPEPEPEPEFELFTNEVIKSIIPPQDMVYAIKDVHEGCKQVSKDVQLEESCVVPKKKRGRPKKIVEEKPKEEKFNYGFPIL